MEKYYMFLMTNNSRAFGEDGGACVLEAGRAVQGGFPWAGGETSIKAAQVCLCNDPQNVHQGPDVKWVDVTEASAAFSEYLRHSCPDQLVDQDRTTGLAENLHDLASHFPDNGMVLDVIWPLDVVKHLALSDHTALFGALKRLVEWHGAFVHILLPAGTHTDAGSVPPGVQPWADLLHASLLTTPQLQDDLAAGQWRGHVNITGSKGTKSLRLPHFCLSAHNDSQLPKPRATLRVKTSDTDHTDALPAGGGHVTGGYLEFVTAVKRSQIPSLYLTNHAYRFSVPSCSSHLTPSRTFLRKLANDATAAYILRVRHGQRWRAPPPAGGVGRGRTQPKQKEWKDSVMDNIANVTDDRCVAEVAGDVTGRQFLVWYRPPSPGGSRNSGDYVAFLLRRPDDISGHMTMMLAKQELRLASCDPAMTSCDASVTLKVADLLSRLPHYDGEDLLQQEAAVQTAQLTALKAWLDERRCETVDGELSVREVVMLLRTVRRLGWDTLQEAGVYSRTRPDTKRRLAAVKPEYEADVLSQWEGISLRLRETAAGVRLLKRHSDDSLGGLAPPTGQVVTLDANEFLKHFNDDGTAQKTDRSVLRPLKVGLPPELELSGSSWHHVDRSPSRRFCKYNSGDITRSEWPACLRARDHGIYYNCEERAALERQCERMRGRLQAGETASTCTLQQTHNPATITLTDTATPTPGADARDTRSTSRADTHNTDQSTALNADRPTNKRKASPDQLVSHSKRLLVERKRRQAEKVQTSSQQKKDTARHKKPNHAATGTTGPAADATKTESRSQRHKRKLQEIVELSLSKRGVTKDDNIFASCVGKLFMLTKCFVKDLKTSHNLRQEMEKIAESNVDQVIEFARRNKT